MSSLSCLAARHADGGLAAPRFAGFASHQRCRGVGEGSIDPTVIAGWYLRSARSRDTVRLITGIDADIHEMRHGHGW